MKIFLLAFLLFCNSAIAQVAAIKNIQPSTYTISRHEVYWIYTLKTRFWSDGTKITVFYLDFNNPTHVAFCKNVLGVNPISFQNSVDTYINVGNAAYFRKANSEYEVYRQVSRINGAVGYVSDKILLINVGNDNVREINITE